MNSNRFVKPNNDKSNEKSNESVVELTFQEKNTYCVYTQHLPSPFHTNMLTAEYWQQQNAITGTAQGRGTTYFIQHQDHQWVLRHYYRGGLIGKLINDSYWFTGLENTRAAKEFSLLKTLQQLNLPAPKPVAYQVTKKGLLYSADLLSSRIENAQDLVAILQEKPLNKEVWFNIGKMIQAFHANGIYHHDLNSHNILLDNALKPWLIDFDRGEQKTINVQWQQANMSRLLRSFNKEKQKLAQFHWHESDWQALLAGYQSNDNTAS